MLGSQEFNFPTRFDRGSWVATTGLVSRVQRGSLAAFLHASPLPQERQARAELTVAASDFVGGGENLSCVAWTSPSYRQ